MQRDRLSHSTFLRQKKAASRSGSGDEMIISAGDFLVHALKPAARRLALERAGVCCAAFAVVGESAHNRLQPHVAATQYWHSCLTRARLHVSNGHAASLLRPCMGLGAGKLNML